MANIKMASLPHSTSLPVPPVTTSCNGEQFTCLCVQWEMTNAKTGQNQVTQVTWTPPVKIVLGLGLGLRLGCGAERIYTLPIVLEL